jgi:hypothetical protein
MFNMFVVRTPNGMTYTFPIISFVLYLLQRRPDEKIAVIGTLRAASIAYGQEIGLREAKELVEYVMENQHLFNQISSTFALVKTRLLEESR